VDIVVDEQIAVLKVLAFRNTVGGNEQFDFLVLGETRLFGPAFREGGKVC